MPLTYDPIATATSNGSVATITFDNIPNTYTDLVIVCFSRSGTTGTFTDIYLRLGTGGGAVDSGNNYSTTRLLGNGSSASSDRFTSSSLIYGSQIPASGSTSGVFATSIHNIQNYTSSSVNKTVLNRGNDPVNFVSANVGLWRNTGSVTSVALLTNASFISGSTFTLYGIKAA